MIGRVSVGVGAAILLLGLSACGGSGNPLIGKWKLASGDCPTIRMSFDGNSETATTEAIGPHPEQTDTVAVTYSTRDKRKIYVMGNRGAANAFFYNFLGPDRIVLNGDQCVYQRQP